MKRTFLTIIHRLPNQFGRIEKLLAVLVLFGNDKEASERAMELFKVEREINGMIICYVCVHVSWWVEYICCRRGSILEDANKFFGFGSYNNESFVLVCVFRVWWSGHAPRLHERGCFHGFLSTNSQ